MSADDSHLRVLIADDEPDVRLLLRLGLRHHDISIVGEAADGQEVLEACAAARSTRSSSTCSCRR